MGQLWKGEQFQDCLEEARFHEGFERGGKRLGGEKEVVRIPDSSLPSQASLLISVYPPCRVLAWIISSLELVSVSLLTSKGLEEGKSGRVLRCCTSEMY